jgi:hypothetical protein
MDLRRAGILVAAGYLGGLVACSDGVAPTPPPTPAQSAEMFDSLYRAELAAGDTSAGEFVAYELEFPPAYGAQETDFTAATANGLQRWKGFIVEELDNDGDSLITAILFSDDSLTNTIYVGQDQLTTQFSQAQLQHLPLDDTTTNPAEEAANSFNATGTITASLVSTGGTCALQSGLAAGAIIAVPPNAGCTNATFTLSATLQFPTDSTVSALRSFSFSNVTFHGPRFTNLYLGSHPVRPPV